MDILNIGRVYQDGEQQALGVGDDVTLAPLDPLGGVKAARAAALRPSAWRARTTSLAAA